jgi:hypothetical protein
MIGSHRLRTFNAQTLRKAVKVASRPGKPVVIVHEALADAGIPYGSDAFKEWLQAIPCLEWHTWHNNKLTLHFGKACSI